MLSRSFEHDQGKALNVRCVHNMKKCNGEGVIMFVLIQGIDRDWELAVLFDALFVWLIVVFLVVSRCINLYTRIGAGHLHS